MSENTVTFFSFEPFKPGTLVEINLSRICLIEGNELPTADVERFIPISEALRIFGAHPVAMILSTCPVGVYANVLLDTKRYWIPWRGVKLLKRSTRSVAAGTHTST